LPPGEIAGHTLLVLDSVSATGSACSKNKNRGTLGVPQQKFHSERVRKLPYLAERRAEC